MSAEKATCPMTGEKGPIVVGFNKSKEDFIWFVKKAVSDKKSSAYAELFHTLLKMFVDADTKQDGLVTRANFSKLIDLAAALPRLYGYAPTDEELYKTTEDKVAARTKMFDTMDTKASGVLTFDEWLKFNLEHIKGKVAGLDPHPILDHGDKTHFLAFVKKAVAVGTNENIEMYWHLLEMFLDHDANKDGNVTVGHFIEMVDSVLQVPVKLGLLPVDLVEFGGDKAKKITERAAMFKKYNTRGDGKMTFDEWLGFALEVVFKKIAADWTGERSSHVVGFHKSKEDFIWFIKKAILDKKSSAYAELFHTLLKMFVDADTKQDGLVTRANFSKLIDLAAALPRLYGYAPTDEELYKTTEDKVAARTKMFDTMDTKASGVITFDEWLKFALEHIAGKVSGLDPHPILDHGDKTQFTTFVKKAVTAGTAEHLEMYWYLLEMFLDHDNNKDGNVTMAHFVEMVDAALELPVKLALLPADLVEFGGDKNKKMKAREVMFKKYNTRGDGNMTFDEFLACAMETVFKKIK